jgi:hypothetical protein
MIPDFITYPGSLWPLLPPGIHDATLEEVYDRFVVNEPRKILYEGMLKGINMLFRSGCQQVFLDGSYVTEKPIPNDYEICWDGRFVDPSLLDPVFFDFNNMRKAQKDKYKGEYFPSFWIETHSGKPFLDFFQNDRETGKPKGIIRIMNNLN